MSTFGGKIREIPSISVDRFDENNLDSEAYFLSHCHSDHMVGLNTKIFRDSLKQRGCHLYASHITKAILKNIHPDIQDQIIELDFHTTTPIYLKDICISVILIPSGHCPGSVMFLFETNKTVLYTGDFRMKLIDLKNIKAFYDSYGAIKNIDALYLDTTFFLKDYSKFPSREESLDQVIKLIEEWINLGENHMIDLTTSARYGYEYIFMEIFKKIKMPIHIDKKAHDFYSLVPQLDGAVTLDGEKTRIHCSCESFFTICKDKNKFNIRTIKMSAMRWKNSNMEEGLSTTSPNKIETHFICYSTHSSYTEIEEIVEFLKPEVIEPCVLWGDENINSQIYGSIDRLLRVENEHVPKRPKLFNLKKIEKLQEKEKPEEKDREYDEMFDLVLDSP